MEERRLYAILAAGGAVVVAIALIDAVTGDGDGGNEPAPTTASRPSTTITLPATSTASLDKQTQDRLVQADLRTALVAMKVVYADQGRYSAETAALAQIEPSLGYVPGIATGAARTGAVYVESDGTGQVACASARSPSGELFLIKDVRQGGAPGTWYARGATLPTRCDDEPLATSW